MTGGSGKSRTLLRSLSGTPTRHPHTSIYLAIHACQHWRRTPHAATPTLSLRHGLDADRRLVVRIPSLRRLGLRGSLGVVGGPDAVCDLVPRLALRELDVSHCTYVPARLTWKNSRACLCLIYIGMYVRM